MTGQGLLKGKGNRRSNAKPSKHGHSNAAGREKTDRESGEKICGEEAVMISSLGDGGALWGPTLLIDTCSRVLISRGWCEHVDIMFFELLCCNWREWGPLAAAAVSGSAPANLA